MKVSKLGRDSFLRFRKPVPNKPTKEMTPRKAQSREKNIVKELIEEGIEEYKETKEEI